MIEKPNISDESIITALNENYSIQANRIEFLQVVNNEQGLTDLPVITHMDFGHTSPICVLPYGVQAEIDCEKKRFLILENAVTD